MNETGKTFLFLLSERGKHQPIGIFKYATHVQEYIRKQVEFRHDGNDSLIRCDGVNYDIFKVEVLDEQV